MKYYEDLAELQCFSIAQAEKIIGNTARTKNLILDYKRKGYIESVKRNLYVVISLETKQPIANRYKIASSITKSSYISHHTAFEYYGCANQVFNDVYVSGEQKFMNFEYDDIVYSFISSRLNTGIELKENNIKVTSIERTIIDSINDFEKIAGIEELLRCLELVPYANEKKLLLYLRQYDKQIIFQKTGYILEHYKKQLRLSDGFFVECKKHIKNSVRYLYKDLESSSYKFDNEWKLIVPNDLMKLISEGDITDAPV